MRRSFYFVQFLTAEGWQVGPTTTTLRIARKRAAWYSFAQAVRIMRGGQGCELVEVIR